MTRLLVLAVASCLAIAGAGCSGADSGTAASTRPSASTHRPDLVELPPVVTIPTTSAPVVGTSSPDSSVPIASEPPTTTTPESVTLGAWDWGAPCRVPVSQVIGPRPTGTSRSFDLVVSESGNGYRLDFEDVETTLAGRTEASLARYLADQVAVLPAILLDDRGGFLRFDGLERELRDLEARAASSVDVGAGYVLLVESLLRSTTIDAWAGYWLDRGDLGPDGVSSVEDRTLVTIEYPADVTAGAAEVVSGPRIEEFGENSARFSYTEFGPDLATLDGPSFALDIVAAAFIEVDRARPLQATAQTNLYSTADGGRTTLFDLTVESSFDWDDAEGCA